ncbi:MAG: hypothetical protein IAF02_21340 [Anaerolineae bacterium]|nr:hypothetical protein [Anaerolineae bacterium]
MSTKLIMNWDIRPETESEYFEFLVHEFIPGMNRLGIGDIQVWYTTYGECEQKLATGITPDIEQMQTALGSDDWEKMTDKLNRYVTDLHLKVIPATKGFQM